MRALTRFGRRRTPVAASLLALLAWLCTPAGPARAEATVTVVNLDPPGTGMNDPTPATPIGGNPGTTLGEQRFNALQYAADLWGMALDSDVEIRIDANFEDLPCMADGAVLGAASTTAAVSNLGVAGANPAWSYPSAVANRLYGSDLDTGSADIIARFNNLDPQLCGTGAGWYYGFDANPGATHEADLVEVALHELAHGLGITMLMDQTTGELVNDRPDPLIAQALDTTSGSSLADLNPDQRIDALTSPRSVVWTGRRANGLADGILAKGSPQLSTSPPVTGFSGQVADANFGAPPLQRSTSGRLVIADPLSGERQPRGNINGAVVLFEPQVPPPDLAAAVEMLGAAALLMVLPGPYDAPPTPLDYPAPATSDVPVLSITVADGQALVDAAVTGSVTVNIGVAPEQPIGADSMGRLRLNAATPLQTSIFGHWDTSLRPNQLMEPFTAVREDPHELDLARAWLQDIGWSGRCGDGQVADDEQCDAGPDNSDVRADACRSDCTLPTCGDGVRDSGEACDDGEANSDLMADACRRDCTLPSCGDGVVDRGEACDDGDTPPADGPPCAADCSTQLCADGSTPMADERCPTNVPPGVPSADAGDTKCTRCSLACPELCTGAPPAAGASAPPVATQPDAGAAGASEGTSGGSDSGCSCGIAGAPGRRSPVGAGLAVVGLLGLVVRIRRRRAP